MNSHCVADIPKNDYVNKFKPPPGITYGVHTGDANYKPENPLAWGPKGEWNTKKTFEAVGFEEQAKATMCTLNPQGACLRGGRRSVTSLAPPWARPLRRTGR